jgi:hypothetical protein
MKELFEDILNFFFDLLDLFIKGSEKRKLIIYIAIFAVFAIVGVVIMLFIGE